MEEKQQFVDPHAPMHKRILEQEIGGTKFEFTWTRITVGELLSAIAGNRETPDEKTKDVMRRMLLKVVDRSQKGLMIDLLNNRANFSLAQKLITGMIPLITENVTVIGKPEYSQDGDIKRFKIPLITDDNLEVFEFSSDRNQYDEFLSMQEDPASDPSDEIHNFLCDCIEDVEQKGRFNLLVYDERNFTLSIKTYGKVRDFLARNEAIIKPLTPKPSAK